MIETMGQVATKEAYSSSREILNFKAIPISLIFIFFTNYILHHPDIFLKDLNYNKNTKERERVKLNF